MTNSTTPTNIGKIRDHLANERTFLAWIRTSISIIVFGFVVAKFGITLRQFFLMQYHAKTSNQSNISLDIGMGFMLMGIVMAILAMIQYRKTMLAIDLEQFKPSTTTILFLGIVTTVFGSIMITYLMITAWYM